MPKLEIYLSEIKQIFFLNLKNARIILTYNLNNLGWQDIVQTLIQPEIVLAADHPSLELLKYKILHNINLYKI